MVLLFHSGRLKLALIRIINRLLLVHWSWWTSASHQFISNIIILAILSVDPIKELCVALNLLLYSRLSESLIECHLIFDAHRPGNPHLAHKFGPASLYAHDVPELKSFVVQLVRIVYYRLLRRYSHGLEKGFLVSKLQGGETAILKILRPWMLALEIKLMAGWILRYFRNWCILQSITFKRWLEFGQRGLFLSRYDRSIIVLNGFFIRWTNYFG